MSTPGDRIQLVLCGLGGQGIVFLSRVIAGAAVMDRRGVLTSEAHGMSQRGGAVESHLKLGGYHSSTIRRGAAHVALALDASRLAAARSYLRPEGICIANAPGALEGADTCDATEIARELGHVRGANLVLLGFAVATRPDLFPKGAAILDAIDDFSAGPAAEANADAFVRGASLGAAGVIHE